jgi:hypothetical protein
MFHDISKIDTIRQRNRAAGQYFFSPGAMRFFDSIVYPEVYGGRYFITSERAPGFKRKFTIREALDSGEIKTVGKFQQYSSHVHAVSVVRSMT